MFLDKKDISKLLMHKYEENVTLIYIVYYICIILITRFLCVQLFLWINEKMLTAQDMSYDEARNLHSKWLKHQAFMAELQSNKEWLDKIKKVG